MANNPEWLEKALAKIDQMEPGELYKSLFGFYESEYIEYCKDKQYEFEAQYVIDVMKKMEITEVNIYDGTLQPPSKMFFHYLQQEATEGTDDEFWNGWGADTLDVPNFPLRYLWVNGQGTEHFFQIIA